MLVTSGGVAGRWPVFADVGVRGLAGSESIDNDGALCELRSSWGAAIGLADQPLRPSPQLLELWATSGNCHCGIFVAAC